jgi:hypothetical protein
MSDKVYYSVLGVIAVALIGAFVGLVMPTMSEYSEISQKLESRVRSLGQFAGNPPEKLPSETLVEKKQRYQTRWQESVAKARGIHEAREDRIAQPVRRVGGDRAQWVAAYRDAFADLAARYRTSRGLAAEAPVPFAEMEEPEAAHLVRAEKAWRVQSLLIEEVIAGGGEVISYTSTANKSAEQMNRDDPRVNFKFDRVAMKAKLPPSRLSGFLATIVGHPDLDLEIAELVVGKDEKQLIYDLIQREETAVKAEPHAIISIALNVLTWSPEAPAVEEGSDGDEKGEKSGKSDKDEKDREKPR